RGGHKGAKPAGRERLRIIIRKRLGQRLGDHWGALGREELLHAFGDACGNSVLAPPVWGLAPGKVLTLAGRAHEAVLLAGITGTAHEDRAVVLGLHVLPQDELGGALNPAVDGEG